MGGGAARPKSATRVDAMNIPVSPDIGVATPSESGDNEHLVELLLKDAELDQAACMGV